MSHHSILAQILNIFSNDLIELCNDCQFFTRKSNAGDIIHSIMFPNINQELNRADYRTARKLLDSHGFDSFCTGSNNLVVYF